MSPLKPCLAALALLFAATPALSQSAQALAARDVTEAEVAFLTDTYAEAVDEQLEDVMVGLRPMSAMLHEVFPPTLHGEVDATVIAYFESQRPALRARMMRALAESMTLEEMRGVGLNTRRSLEISQYVSGEMQVVGQRLALDAVRHLCSVIHDRAPEECRALLDNADLYEAQIGG